MNGDIDAYRDPMDMLREATQYLDRVRQTLIEAANIGALLVVNGVYKENTAGNHEHFR